LQAATNANAPFQRVESQRSAAFSYRAGFFSAYRNSSPERLLQGQLRLFSGGVGGEQVVVLDRPREIARGCPYAVMLRPAEAERREGR
jgi:hypothetical protein